MFFSVGYPMGWYKTSEAPKYRNRIEFNGKFVMLDIFSTTIWIALNISNSSESLAIQEIKEMLAEEGTIIQNDTLIPNCIDELIEDGAVIRADTNEEFFYKIKDFKVIRNGFPEFEHEAMTNFQELKSIIDKSPVSDLQLDIWRKANGVNTLEQILKENFATMTISDFMDNVIYLRDETLIFIV